MVEISFALFGGVVVGFVIACFVCVGASDISDSNAEKAGIWTIKGRAYRLTKIDRS